MNLIILPVVCGISMTQRCLDTLYAQDISDVHVVAYDNGSRDGVGPYLRSLQLRTTIVPFPRMRSLNKLWNHALDTAFRSLQLDYVLIVNNDTELRPDTYRLLVAHGGDFVTGVGVADREQTLTASPEKESPHPDFSCFLMRRKCYETVGPFDEQFFAYASDNDYHIRMHRAGISAVSLALPFYHIASGTIKTADLQVRAEICARAEQDRDTFLRKYGFTVDSDEYKAQFISDPGHRQITSPEVVNLT